MLSLIHIYMTGISNAGSAGGIPVVLIIGVVMLLAQGRSAKGFGRVTAVISAIYNGVTGYFGDILSYSRLMVMIFVILLPPSLRYDTEHFIWGHHTIFRLPAQRKSTQLTLK